MSDSRTIIDPVTWMELEVPAYATDESALRKAQRRREGALPVLILEPDFGCVFPLWIDGAPTDPVLSDVPTSLQADLRSWLTIWEQGFNFETGWRASAPRIKWAQQGEELFRRLSRELWEVADVLPAFRKMTAEGA
jgi:hypothetical protein